MPESVHNAGGPDAASTRDRGSRPVGGGGPPDGGWGWIVVLAAFASHLVSHGVLYSFGIMFIALQEEFGSDKVTTAWIGSLATGCLFLSGPVAGQLTERYGCRTVAVLGALVAAVGYGLSVFASNIYLLYATMGAMAGVGYGLIFLSSVVCVTQYFVTRRAIACCMALSGAATGAFVFNPLVQLLLDSFGLRGAMLIQAGIILNCAVFGALYRPLPPLGQTPVTDGTNFKENNGLTFAASTGNTKQPLSTVRNDIHTNGVLIKKALLSEKPPDDSDTEDESAVLRAESADLIGHLDKEAFSSRRLRRQSSVPCVTSELLEITVELEHRKLNSLLFYSQPVLTGSYISLHPGSQLEGHGSSHLTLQQEHTIRGTVLQYVALFKDRAFVMLLVAVASLHFGAYIPFIYLPDKAVKAGLGEYVAALLVSIMGIASVIGRVLFGYIADRPGINRSYLFGASLLLSGLSTALAFCYHSLPLLALYVSVYGAFVGVAICLISVVLVDLLGLERLPRALGVSNLVNGLMCLAGPVVAGAIYDHTGSYDLGFLIAGSVMVAGALVLFVTSCLRDRAPVAYSSTTYNVQ